MDVCKKDFTTKTSTICCYPTDVSFIKSHVNEIIKKIEKLKDYKLIFSAHGLEKY